MAPACPQHPRLLLSSGFILSTALCSITSWPKMAAERHGVCIPGRKQDEGHMHAPCLPLTKLSQGFHTTIPISLSLLATREAGTFETSGLLRGYIAPRTEYVFCYHREREMSCGLTNVVSVTASSCDCVLGTVRSQEELCPAPTPCLCFLAMGP